MVKQKSDLEVELKKGQLQVYFRSRLILRHSHRAPLLSLGHGQDRISMHHGNFRIRENLKWRRALRHATIISNTPDHLSLRFHSPDSNVPAMLVHLRVQEELVQGELTLEQVESRPAGGRPPQQPAAPTATETHAGTPDQPANPAANQSGAGLDTGTPESVVNRVWLRLPAVRGESVYGGGEQYSRFDLRGCRLPLWTQEQGVGRSRNLVTLAANLHSAAGGRWYSTYYPQPSYVTESGRVVHLDCSAYSVFDFGSKTMDLLEVWQPQFRFWLGVEEDLARAVSRLSLFLGRQPELPDWADTGMWLGLQGGTDLVRQKVDRALEAGVALSGVWVQDWEGRRVTSFGSQLFWNWRFDSDRYPDLPGFIQELREKGVRFLGYINPWLALEGDLYKEASKRGLVVKNPEGGDYHIVVTTFPAALLDLTNPETNEWIKEVIKKDMIGIGLSGWMADYGEYLPTDAVLHSGIDARLFHNRYPTEWARVNFEAIQEAGAQDEVAIFTRAGFSGTGKYVHTVWAGDQMVDWSRHDGIPSVMPAALSMGMSGVGVHHSDLGGFTSLFGVTRRRQLYLRWAELSAFSPIMRSHESNRPATNWQFDADEGTLRHTARMSRIFRELRDYRRHVLSEYYVAGLPAMRPVVLHYPGAVPQETLLTSPGPWPIPPDTTEHLPIELDTDTSPKIRPWWRWRWNRGRGLRGAYRYLFGRDLLVVPVVRKGVKRVTVNLPPDTWVHLWTGKVFDGGNATVSATPGEPPVFYRADSRYRETFERVAQV